jgi:hypothetical protein
MTSATSLAWSVGGFISVAVLRGVINVENWGSALPVLGEVSTDDQVSNRICYPVGLDHATCRDHLVGPRVTYLVHQDWSCGSCPNLSATTR